MKKKVTILGAGPSGLAAAFGLTHSKEARERFDITVYQVGWRAGGKCATGRDPENLRLSQNGSHYFFGCYDNTFHLTRETYEALQALGDRRFGAFDDAFEPQNELAMKQFFADQWQEWVFDMPQNNLPLGKADAPFFSLSDVLLVGAMLLGALVRSQLPRGVQGWLRPIERLMDPPPAFRKVLNPIFAQIEEDIDRGGVALLDMIQRVAKRAEKNSRDPILFNALVWWYRAFRSVVWALCRPTVYTNVVTNRVWLTVDFVCSCAIGMLDDKLFDFESMERIDDEEFRAWLKRHGASEMTLNGPNIAAWYAAVAAYENGDPMRPNLAAGVTLMSLIRAFFAYKGAFAYHMKDEVGDTIIAPLYFLLKERGVKFMFFHRVWDVEPAADGDRIARVSVERQVDLKTGDPASYEPLIQGKYWPDRPRDEQIVQDVSGHDLESFYTTWPRGQMVELEAGRDFDTLVFALPVGAIPFYAKKLVEQKDSWARMVQHVKSVETRSVRLYFSKSLEELGWKHGRPILTSYAQPFPTWEDNGDLAQTEKWPPGMTPKVVATLFGGLPCPDLPPGPDASWYPAMQKTVVDTSGMHFLTSAASSLWPGASDRLNPGSLDWDVLVDPEGRTGPRRYEAQDRHANVGPIQRYTMSVAGSTRHRLRPDESGYSNLLLCGDWTRNGFETGSVEGAVMAGFEVSRRLGGYPERLIGYGD